MDTPKSASSLPAKKNCSVCAKELVRARRFLLDGVVTNFCPTCVKKAPTVPMVGKSTEHVVCRECSEIFSHTSAMSRHSKHQHTSVKPVFPCTDCGKKYSQNDSLVLHREQHHGGKKNKFVAANPKPSGRLNSVETDLSSEFSGDLEESSSRPVMRPSSSTLELPRKRRAAVAAEDEDGSVGHEEVDRMDATEPPPLTHMQNWCLTLATHLEEMPETDQFEMQMAFGFMIGQKQMEILARDGESAQDADQAETPPDGNAVGNPVKSEAE